MLKAKVVTCFWSLRKEKWRNGRNSIKSVKEAVKTVMAVIIGFTVTNLLQTDSYMCKNHSPPLMNGWDDLGSKI